MRRTLIAASAAIMAGGAAAQSLTPATPSVSAHADAPAVQTLATSAARPLSESDSAALTEVLVAARGGDSGRVRSLSVNLQDPVARKIALYEIVDLSPESMSYAELDGARRDLAGWPRSAKRAAATERMLETGGLGPRGIIDWFAGAEPQTPQGAMALASAYQATGQAPKAADLIRNFWRTRTFDADVQQPMLARFGAVLTADDHAARVDALLYGYGSQVTAARDLLPFLAPDQRALAEARMALRAGSGEAEALVAALPANLQTSPGLAYERAQAYARRGDTPEALAQMPYLRATLPQDDDSGRMWKLRYPLVIAALKSGDVRGAYAAAAHTGMTSGPDAAEAEFYAGWLALAKLRDPKLADEHFALLQGIGSSPITQGRALYWRGRANEAAGDEVKPSCSMRTPRGSTPPSTASWRRARRARPPSASAATRTSRRPTARASSPASRSEPRG
ncbi:MAG: hypothetical protein ACHP84_20340 [Caulobacterales bacterium]